MRKKYLWLSLLALCLCAVFLLDPVTASARSRWGFYWGSPGWGYGGYSRWGHWGRHRYGYWEPVYVGYRRYYYDGDCFYRPQYFGLCNTVVTPPPRGAIVTTLPYGYRTVIVDGVRYHYYNDIYYLNTSSGYVVVSPPEVKTGAAAAAPAATETKETSGGNVTVNVPNSDGSYTTVTLTKKEGGYVGPQGEFYPGNPTVDQLKVLYAK